VAESRGEGLSKKERTFHEKALIGILKQIHDELDEAVAEAYGWPVDLSDEEVLERLVALNHERAAEEKQGIIRWLRPEFQDPDGTRSTKQKEFDVTAEDKVILPKGPKPWPKSATDQLRAVRDLFATRSGTWTVDDVAAAFKHAHKATVRRHLETMEALGILKAYEDESGKRWDAVKN